MLETFFEPGEVLDGLNKNGHKDISVSSTVVCTNDNLSCELQDEAVLLNLQSGTYFGLNPLGARIWRLIQQPIKVGDVLQELMKEYDVDGVQCEADLLSFLKALQAHSLIKVLAADTNLSSGA
jgi:hypothetical protein